MGTTRPRPRLFLQDKKVVITAGPTREHLDPVRYLSNASSGRMGCALARAARRAGARVVLICGPCALPLPKSISVRRVVSAADMHSAALKQAGGADLFIGAAAVADWKPLRPCARKIKKTGEGRYLTLTFVKNQDIVADVARRAKKGKPFVVGFALETDHLLKNARAKLRQKRLNLIVANPAEALDRRRFRAWVLGADGAQTAWPMASKEKQAERILRAAAARMETTA